MPKRDPLPLDGPRSRALAAIQDRNLSLSDLSSAIGRNGTYIQQWLRYGVPRTFPEKERKLLAKELGLPESELMPDGRDTSISSVELSSGYREPPPLFVGTIPLYASAEGGRGHVIVSTDEIGRAPRPDILVGADYAYAILVTGTSMKDTYEPGDRALVNPHLGPERETDCILYSVKDGEATATIKRLVTWTDREWTLRQNNPPKTFKLDRGLWQTHHRVVGNLKKSFGGRVPFGAV